MTKDAARRRAAKYREWADKAITNAEAIETALKADPRFTDMQFWTEPIKIGHHSERGHRSTRARYTAKMDKALELRAKAKAMREKADNLEAFANRNAGDAARKRKELRAEADKRFTVGSRVFDPCFRGGVITKVNKNTYTVRYDRGFSFSRDKVYFLRLTNPELLK